MHTWMCTTHITAVHSRVVFVYPRVFSCFFSRAWKRWETSAPRLISRPKCRPATPCRENTPLSASARNGSVTSTSTGVSCRGIPSLLGSGNRRSLPAHDLRGARERRRRESKLGRGTKSWIEKSKQVLLLVGFSLSPLACHEHSHQMRFPRQGPAVLTA